MPPENDPPLIVPILPTILNPEAVVGDDISDVGPPIV